MRCITRPARGDQRTRWNSALAPRASERPIAKTIAPATCAASTARITRMDPVIGEAIPAMAWSMPRSAGLKCCGLYVVSRAVLSMCLTIAGIGSQCAILAKINCPGGAANAPTKPIASALRQRLPPMLMRTAFVFRTSGRFWGTPNARSVR